jgi:hypothetical protein
MRGVLYVWLELVMPHVARCFMRDDKAYQYLSNSIRSTVPPQRVAGREGCHSTPGCQIGIHGPYWLSFIFPTFIGQLRASTRQTFTGVRDVKAIPRTSF